MDHLIIAFFQLSIDVNILYVKYTKMHKDLATVRSPGFKVNLSLFIDLERFLLNLKLLLEIIQRVL